MKMKKIIAWILALCLLPACVLATEQEEIPSLKEIYAGRTAGK